MTAGVDRVAPPATEPTVEPPAGVPSGANADGDGIVVGSGPVTVDAYVDFQCPFCRMFEEQSGPALRRMVSEGLISLVYHPLAFLDQLSTTHYSSRASSSSGCAADGGMFAEYEQALFANQPPEGSAGLSDAELIAIGHAAGLDDASFDRCVAAYAYLPWTAYVTGRAIAQGVQGTPTVFVAGAPVPASARTIAAAVAVAAG
jgi:protein-disulfide isomerase